MATNEALIGDAPHDAQQEQVQGKWRWVLVAWKSALFDELEVRPWTPLVIGGRFCFSARDQGKWHVVWGDAVSPAYDDAYDTCDYERQPLYLARQGGHYFLVWGTRRSQEFPFQITYLRKPGGVFIKRFISGPQGKEQQPAPDEEIIAEWQ